MERTQEEMKHYDYYGELEPAKAKDVPLPSYTAPKLSSVEIHQPRVSLPSLVQQFPASEKQKDEWDTSLDSDSYSMMMGSRSKKEINRKCSDYGDEIKPNDSASNISQMRSGVSSRASSSSVRKARIREVELAARAAATRRTNEIKLKKRQLQRRLDEAVMAREIEDTIRSAKERAEQMRMQREVEEENERLDELETEINIAADYEAAKATTRVLLNLSDQSSVCSIVDANSIAKAIESAAAQKLDTFAKQVYAPEGQQQIGTFNTEKIGQLASKIDVDDTRVQPAYSEADNQNPLSLLQVNGGKQPKIGASPPQVITSCKPQLGTKTDVDDTRVQPAYSQADNQNPLSFPQVGSCQRSMIECSSPQVYTGCKSPLGTGQPQKVTPQNNEEVNMTTIIKRLIDQQRENALPKQELQVFDGTDMLQYPAFKRNFKYVVEDNTQDPVRRLEMLLKYTSGEAKELIKQCPLIEPPEAGYTRALWLLKRDYGQPTVIAASYSLKAENWPRISNGDKEALRKFAIFLTNCCDAKISNPELVSMNGYEVLRKLASKLPVAIQQKWITQVGKMREGGRSPTIDDLETFVGRIARDENDPRIAGLGYQQRKDGKQSHTNTKVMTKKAVYATTVQPNNQPRNQKNYATKGPCLYCGKDTKHVIAECRKFSALPTKEKVELCRTKGLCFGCMKAGHTRKQCRNPEKCAKCNRRHPTVLHDPSRGQHSPETNYQTRPATTVTTGCVNTNNVGPLMAIVPVLVKTNVGSECIATYAFLDNGCGAVFVADELRRKLNTRTRQTKIFLKTLNSEEVMGTEVFQDQLQISDIKGTTFLDLHRVYVKDVMPVTEEDIPRQQDIDAWQHLQNITLPDIPRSKNSIPRVTLMIGSNVPAATQPLETRIGTDGEPYAIRSPLGWLVYGLIRGKTQDTVCVNFSKVRSHTSIQSNTENLEELFQSYVNRDFSEKLDDGDQPSVEDKKFINILEESVTKVEGHYQTRLPLRDRTKAMPNNYSQAASYAQALRRRLLKDDKLKKDYTEFMENLETEGYAERVPEQDKNRQDGKVWYIPHHCVHNPRKPDKVRVVFNCPVKHQGTSLNEQLLQGPDLTNRLVGVILRWRQENIAIMADIKSMFYQVRVHPDDCDLLRYLWWPRGDLHEEPEEYRMLVHVFGAVSSPSIANYVLQKTALDNADKYGTEVTHAILNDFYVDDMLKSVAEEEEAIEVARKIKDALQEGGFRLTKWVSNNQEVLKTIPIEERSKEVKSLDPDGRTMQRALGVQWYVEEDLLGFAVNEVNKKATRRNILSVMSSMYDPLGFTAPFILRAKILLQELCIEKLTWDEEIPAHYRAKWEKWLLDLPALKDLKMKRCYKPEGFGKPTKVEIHHFADASECAYGTVSYIRYLNSLEGKVHCSFVIAKARVAPVKPMTIPRLELTAATVAVRVNTMIMKELQVPVDEVHYFTDSQTVLRYINNEKTRFRTFVANRIQTIREGSQPSQWHYIESNKNPADDASRGLTLTNLLKTERWFRGPQFLWNMESEWPTWSNKEESDKSLEGDEEVKKSAAKSRSEPVKTNIQVNVVKPKEQEDMVSTLITYFSSWTRLRRAVGWWLRLKKILLQKSRKQQTAEEPKSLSVNEINLAEETIVKFVQRQTFPEEISDLQKTEECNNHPDSETVVNRDQVKRIRKSSELTHLDPVLSHGILKVGGRLRNAPISEDAKHQWILPKDHHVTKLIISHVHQMCNHQGKNHVMSELRQKYWIIRGGVAVKKIVNKCPVCRRQQARLGTQKMADLPASRVKANEPPFTYTGIDYFGPFEVKQGRSIKKRYGVIFTCMNSRAVHLEIAECMDTSSCVNALRRFVCRRGQVKEITSDNGTNLCGADRELQKAIQELDQQVLHTWTADKGITWKYNPPAASHHGGVWERLIRSVRQILQATLREQHLKVARSEEQLQTLMCEVENTLNSRPLTRVSEDPNDLDVITPNHLLQLRNQEQYPPGKFTEEDKYARQRWRQVQFLADLFWQRWVREYLPTLQRRQKWLHPERNYKVGDIVLIADPQAPRNSWPMGKIESVRVGSQGYVRSATIKTKSTTLVRPISKLCLVLEQDA